MVYTIKKTFPIDSGGINRAIGLSVLIARDIGESNYSSASDITEDLLRNGITMHGIFGYDGVRIKISYVESRMRQRLKSLGFGLFAGIPYEGYVRMILDDINYDYSTQTIEDLLRDIEDCSRNDFQPEVAAA